MEFHCRICNVGVNSEKQLQAHFAGKSHKKKVEGTDLPNSGAVPTAQPTTVGQSLVYSSFVDQTTQQGPVLPTGDIGDFNLPFVAATTGNQSAQSNPGGEWCATCKVNLTSQVVASAHYRGSKHRKRLRVQSEKLSANENSLAKKVKLEICEVCNVELMPGAREVHLAGSKHQKMLQQSGQQNVYYCPTCKVSLNSKLQMDCHLNGSKHKQAVTDGSAKHTPSTGTVQGKDSVKSSASVQPFINRVLVSQGSAANCKQAEEQEAASFKEITSKDGQGFVNSALLTQTACASYSRQTSQQGIVTQKVTPSTSPASRTVQPGSLFFCSFCNVTVNSQFQMDQHRCGAKHKAMVTKYAAGSTPGSVTNSNFPGRPVLAVAGYSPQSSIPHKPFVSSGFLFTP